MVNKIYYSWNDLDGQVLEIAKQVNQDGFRPDYVVGVTRGGLIPATMLSHYLGVKLHTLDVRLRDTAGDVGPETNCWMSEDAFGYQMDEPKKILIVDDINDSGATFDWIKNDWQSSCLPQDERWNEIWNHTVRFAVLTNNSASSFEVDYFAHEVNKAEKDCWLVYPWEEFWYGSRR